MPDQHSLPDDKDALRAMVVALQAQSDSLQSENLSYEKALQIERAKNDALDRHIATLEQQLAALRRARYGRRSEQLDQHCLLYTSPSPRDATLSRMPSSA